MTTQKSHDYYDKLAAEMDARFGGTPILTPEPAYKSTPAHPKRKSSARAGALAMWKAWFTKHKKRLAYCTSTTEHFFEPLTWYSKSGKLMEKCIHCGLRRSQREEYGTSKEM